MRFGPLVGTAMLAVGRGHGVARFGDTPQAFLASLAPLIAFPLVGATFLLASGARSAAAATLLLSVVLQLGPPVLSHALAVRWGREAEWLRYATAFNWCQWAIPVAGFVMLIGLQIASGGTMTEERATRLLALGLFPYGLWLYWLVARHGLSLSRTRAALLVVLVNAGMILVLMVPLLVQTALG